MTQDSDLSSPHAGEIERKDLNNYNVKPVEVSNDTPAGRAVNRILDKAEIKGIQADEVRDIIEEEYAPLVQAADELVDSLRELINSPNAKQNNAWDRARERLTAYRAAKGK